MPLTLSDVGLSIDAEVPAAKPSATRPLKDGRTNRAGLVVTGATRNRADAARIIMAAANRAHADLDRGWTSLAIAMACAPGGRPRPDDFRLSDAESSALLIAVARAEDLSVRLARALALEALETRDRALLHAVMQHPVWETVQESVAIASGLSDAQAWAAAKDRVALRTTGVPKSRWILLPAAQVRTVVSETTWKNGKPRSQRVPLTGRAWVLITSDRGAEVTFPSGRSVSRSLANDPLRIETGAEKKARERADATRERAEKAERAAAQRARRAAQRAVLAEFRRVLAEPGAGFETAEATPYQELTHWAAWKPTTKAEVRRMLAKDNPTYGGFKGPVEAAALRAALVEGVALGRVRVRFTADNA